LSAAALSLIVHDETQLVQFRERENVSQRPVLGAKLFERAIRKCVAAAGVCGVWARVPITGNSVNPGALSGPLEENQLVRILDRKLFEKDRINHAEQGRVGADTERQREDCRDGERLVLRKHAHAETQVLKHLFLQSSRLHCDRVPERAKATAKQTRAAQRFAVLKFGFPLLPPFRSPTARNESAQCANQPQMGLHQVILVVLTVWYV